VGRVLGSPQLPDAFEFDEDELSSSLFFDVATMNTMLPRVSVVIPNWNGRHLLQICLPSLQHLTYPHVEIIVVDNGSTDDSIPFVQSEFPTVTLVKLSQNRGFTGAVNAGIQTATGEFIALLNNDTEAHPDWLTAAMDAFRRRPDVGFIACLMLDYWQREIINGAGDMISSSGNPFKRGFGRKLTPYFQEEQEVFGACGGAAVYRKTIFDEIGLFDDAYFAYLEDVDWSFRAQLAGYKCLYVPNSIIYHMEGVTAAEVDLDHLAKYNNPLLLETPRKTFWIARNKLYTILKNYPLPLLVRHFPAIVLDGILTSAGFHFLKTGYGWQFVRGVLSAIVHLPPTLLKRWHIQRKKRVSAADIQKLIDRGEDERRTMLLLHGAQSADLPENPKVSVILWGDPDDIDTQIHILQQQTYQNIDVLVDADLAGIQHLENLSLGHFTLLLNTGLEIPPDFIAELVTVAQFDNRIGMVGARLIFDPQEIVGWLISKGGTPVFNIQSPEHSEKQPSELRPIFAPLKVVALYRTDMLYQLGGFDPQFEGEIDEVDLAFRARLTGWEAVLAPRAKARCATLPELATSAKQRWILILKNWTILMWVRYFPQILWENGRYIGQLLRLKPHFADIFHNRRVIQRLRNQPLVLIKRWFHL